MAMIDWCKLLDRFDVNVVYSSMEIDDERGEFDGTIAEIALPDDFFIDISWIPEDRQYAVRLYQGFFENVHQIQYRKSVREVLNVVIDLCEISIRVGNTFMEMGDSSADVLPTYESINDSITTIS